MMGAGGNGALDPGNPQSKDEAKAQRSAQLAVIENNLL